MHGLRRKGEDPPLLFLALGTELFDRTGLTGDGGKAHSDHLLASVASSGHQFCERCPWGQRTCCFCQSTWKALTPYPVWCCHPPSCLSGPISSIPNSAW